MGIGGAACATGGLYFHFARRRWQDEVRATIRAKRVPPIAMSRPEDLAPAGRDGSATARRTVRQRVAELNCGAGRPFQPMGRPIIRRTGALHCIAMSKTIPIGCKSAPIQDWRNRHAASRRIE